jgi:hypothetical protein
VILSNSATIAASLHDLSGMGKNDDICCYPGISPSSNNTVNDGHFIIPLHAFTKSRILENIEIHRRADDEYAY